MKMRDVEIEFSTINGGETQRATQRAIEAAAEHMDTNPNLLGVRKISVEITFTPNGEGRISTASKVETKFPNKTHSGVGWIAGGVAYTMENIVDRSGQLDFLTASEKREADAIRAADRSEREAKERHAMDLRRAEAEDRRASDNTALGRAVASVRDTLAKSGMTMTVEVGSDRHTISAGDDGAEPDTFDGDGDGEDGGVLEGTIAATEARRKPKATESPRRKGG